MQESVGRRPNKVKEKLDEFAKAAGPKNEPRCIYSDIRPIMFGGANMSAFFENDRAINLRVSHVGNRRGKFYPLWGEVGEETSV
jgi:hypothetical protein